MAFVLTANTRGDELVPSSSFVVAESGDRTALEQLRAERKRERDDWLAGHPLPWWAMYGVIRDEEISEVPSVQP